MTDLRKAAEMALEVLEELQFINASFLKCDKAAEALRQALAQPEQKYDYRIKYDRPCYKCQSNFCPGNCKEPEHLAQPEQEPSAWQDPQYKTLIEPHKAHPDWIPLYTAPPSIEAAVLAEREACLKEIAIELDEWNYGTNANIALNNVAANIRARSDK